MASPADVSSAGTLQAPAPAVRLGRKRWLLLGLCFGLGYGVTQRLVNIRLETDWTGSQKFEVKPFPGTELEGLRRRFGEASMEIRGDLDLLELERQQKREAAAVERRREAMEERERRQQDSQEAPQAPAADPAADLPRVPELPSPPVLPEPEPPPAPAASPEAPPAPPTP